MAETPSIDDAVRFVIDNWESLGVTEHGGALHLPTTIKRRNVSGGLDETPVALRNITNAQKFQSRTIARRYALDNSLDLDRDRLLIEDIENYAVLTFAIRDPKPPHDQHVNGVDRLLAIYDTQSLAELWVRYNSWIDMLDPRFGQLSNEQLWQVTARVAKEMDPGFLSVLPGYEQATYIVLLAQEALLSPRRPSWLQPPSTSRQG